MKYSQKSRTMFRMAGAGIVLALGVVGCAGYHENASSPPESNSQVRLAPAAQVSSVKAAFTGAVKAVWSAEGAPSPAYGKLAAAALKAGNVPPTPSAQLRMSQLQTGKAALAKYFTPAEAHHEQVGLINAVRAEANDNFRNISAGASKFKFRRVAVAGSAATVEADVTTWSKIEIRQSASDPWGISDLSQIMDYTATLTLNAARHWVVSSLTGTCVTGCP